MNRLVEEVALLCGFKLVPPSHVRRGRGGDWNPMVGCIRIGRTELGGDDNYLWYIVAHELAHAQSTRREGHSRAFWVRLANGLQQAGRLGLIRYDYEYREGAMRVSVEYGLQDVPKRKEFKLAIGTFVNDVGGRKWMVVRRFRRAGAPYYRLKTRGWRWITSEEVLLPQLKAVYAEES